MVLYCGCAVDIDGIVDIGSTVLIVSAGIESSDVLSIRWVRFEWTFNPLCVSKDRSHNAQLNDMILRLSYTTDFWTKMSENCSVVVEES